MTRTVAPVNLAIWMAAAVDPTACADHQHRLTGTHATYGDQHVPGSDANQRRRSGLVVRKTIGVSRPGCGQGRGTNSGVGAGDVFAQDGETIAAVVPAGEALRTFAAPQSRGWRRTRWPMLQPDTSAPMARWHH